MTVRGNSKRRASSKSKADGRKTTIKAQAEVVQGVIFQLQERLDLATRMVHQLDCRLVDLANATCGQEPVLDLDEHAKNVNVASKLRDGWEKVADRCKKELGIVTTRALRTEAKVEEQHGEDEFQRLQREFEEGRP